MSKNKPKTFFERKVVNRSGEKVYEDDPVIYDIKASDWDYISIHDGDINDIVRKVSEKVEQLLEKCREKITSEINTLLNFFKITRHLRSAEVKVLPVRFENSTYEEMIRRLVEKEDTGKDP